MPATTDTSVKWIDSTMRGAPTLSGTAGALLGVIDALLITGWGLTSAVSVTVADGIATATLTPGETFFKHAVVLVAGATPAALNGEARVLSSTNTSITWATDAPDGTATGTITIKYAPQGQWEKVFSATNVAVYRSTDVTGPRWFYRVDDTNAQYALLAGFEVMSDVDTGEGRFPTAGQQSAGVRIWKSSQVGASSKKYMVAADAMTTIVGAAPHASYPAIFALRGFGQALALNPAGDVYAAFVNGSISTDASNGLFGDGLDSTTGSYGHTYIARGASGIGLAHRAAVFSYAGHVGAVSGNDNFFGVWPSAVDGRMRLSRRFLMSDLPSNFDSVYTNQGGQSLSRLPRCDVPGVYYIPHSGVAPSLPSGALLDIGDRICYAITSAHVPGTVTGAALVDITGPWRGV